jgi:hypothetical protein
VGESNEKAGRVLKRTADFLDIFIYNQPALNLLQSFMAKKDGGHRMKMSSKSGVFLEPFRPDTDFLKKGF